jgi:CHAP domain/WD40-like Beta Propeller Repeat
MSRLLRASFCLPLIAGAASVAVVQASTGHPARAHRTVVVRVGSRVQPGQLVALEAFVPAHRRCRLTLRHGVTVIHSKKRVAHRFDAQFIWKVPKNAAAARWRARVACARGRSTRARAVVQSKLVPIKVVRRRTGAAHTRGPIARAAGIRLVTIAAEPALRAAASSGGWPGWGAVLVAGGKWKVPGLAGRSCNGKSIRWPCGVNVHSNNWAGWPFSPDGKVSGFGFEWQCVELIERFVNLAGFYNGIIPAPSGGAASMYAAADPKFFVRHKNGSGYRPVPGDIVVYSGSEFGHISIVETDNSKAVGVLEQNVWNENGRGSNPWHGRTLLPDPTWAGFRVIGFLHARANTPPIAIGVCGARGEGAPPVPGGICTLLPDGTQRRRITKVAADSEPAWSPDRSKIAFVRTNSQGKRYIEAVGADGSGLKQLTNGTTDQGPAWSPNGKQIAFSRNGQIALLDVATGRVTLLTSGPDDYDPSWSSTGRLIAFASGTAPAEIDVTSSTGANRHTLVVGGLQPAWAPSGNMLAFTRGTGSGFHVAVTNGLTGTPVHDLTSGQADDSYSPAWSPDAKRIAFGRGAARENPGVWVMKADGSHQSRLFGGFDPAW